MSFLRDLFDRLAGRGVSRPGKPTPDGADLRARVEAAIAAEDATELTNALRSRREEGKKLIRRYQHEIEDATDEAARMRLARRITALVAVYDKAFGDREPAGWFRRERGSERSELAGVKLRDAQTAFGAADFERADAEAKAGLDLLSGEPDSSVVRGMISTLLAVRGSVAVRAGRWDDARDLFVRSLDAARASGGDSARAAALLNLIDLHTRRESHAEAAELVEEACAQVESTPYGDVLAKLLVERGVALTRAGDLPAAIESLDRAVASRPHWPFPLYQRGWARFLSGDSGGALEDYRECAGRKRVFFTVQREIRCLEDVAAGRLPLEAYRSFCLLREGVPKNPAEAEASAARMVARYPDFAPAHLLRAEARLAMREPDSAREAAREAMSHDPDPDTAAAALFFDWNVSRARGDEAAAREAAARLGTAYAEHPAAMIVEKVRAATRPNLALRWTFAMDGTLHFEEVDPAGLDTPDSPDGS